MTSISSPSSSRGRVPVATRAAIAALALLLVLRVLLTSGDDEPITWSDVVASLAFTSFALAIALVVVMPRAERTAPAAAMNAAVALAALGIVALPVFWFSGAPFALGASAFVLARAGAPGGRRIAAMALGAFVAAVSLLVALAVTISEFDPTLPA